MDVFFESAAPALVVALLAAACVAVWYINSRRQDVLLWGLSLVAVIGLGGIALERLVETDREQIGESLDRLAAALRAEGLATNSLDSVRAAVLACIAPSATETRALAESNLRLVEILDARHSNLIVKVNRLTNPPTAEVQFDARVVCRGRPPMLNTLVAERAYPLEFDVRMVQEDGRWLVGDRVHWQLKGFGNANPERFGFDTGR